MILALMGFWLPGCATRNPHASAPTQADRILQAYREIQRGRLLIIADFEDPKQLSLFHLERVSGEAQIAHDLRKGRVETGTGCMLATLGSAGDNIIITNHDASEWYLKRDWRPYDLLMLAVHAPQDGLGLEIGVGSGPPEQRTNAYSTTPLRSGWNMIRFDLSEIGEQVPLDDIREMRLAISGADKPVQIRLDDILLAGNRVDLLGDPSNTTGALYARQVGRHWDVGAGGRFEISFANGQITRWYNLASDPYKLRNLVRGAALGPSPVVVDEDEKSFGGFTALGRSILPRQRIVEISPVRIVVECEWRFVDRPDDALDRRPFHRWVYTVYPTGQLFVAVEATTQTPTWSPPRVGLAVTLSSPSQEPVEAIVVSPSAASGSLGATPDEVPSRPAYALARNEVARASMLFLPYPQGPNLRIIERPHALYPQVSWLALDDAPLAPILRWTCQILLATGDAVSEAEAQARALDYTMPAPLRVEVGSLVTAQESPTRGDGFDPAEGAYFVRVERNRSRMTLDGRQRTVFAPAFKISGGQGRESWVYVDNLIFSPVYRSRDGELIYQLPHSIQKNTLVEAFFRHEAASSLP